MKLTKIVFVIINLLLVVISGIRIYLPFYFTFGNKIISTLNYDTRVEVTPFWIVVLVPWDIILAFSGIRSILKNDREQIFENAFRLSIFGLVIIWFINGLGERFQAMAPVTLKRRIKQYDKNLRDRMVVDAIQTQFKCCGYNNMFVWKPETGMPSSCCKDGICNGTNIYTVGCVGPLNEYMDGLNLWLLFTNFPFVELLVGLWSCLLTEYIPTPNIMFELEDMDDDFIENSPRRYYVEETPPRHTLRTISLQPEHLRPRKSSPMATPELPFQSTPFSVTIETH